MIGILGIGWVDDRAFGGIRRGKETVYSETTDLPNAWRQYPCFGPPPKSAGRFNRNTLMTCYAAALALEDAGIPLHRGPGAAIGLVVTNPRGCLVANEQYFRDYIRSGRTLARGNLFIYTLPTSPAAEAATLYGLKGPVLYLDGGENTREEALRAASDKLRGKEADAMVWIHADRSEAMGLVLAADPAGHRICGIGEGLAAVREDRGLSSLVDRFARLYERAPE